MKKIILFFCFFLSVGEIYSDNIVGNNIVKIGVRAKSSDLNPINCNISSFHIVSNIYDPLLRIGSKGELVDGAAKILKVKDREIVFKIDSKYYDGESVKAEVFVDRLKEILTKSNFAQRYFVIHNAEKFVNGEVSFDEVGIKARDDLLFITLEYSSDDPLRAFGSIFAFSAFVPYKYNGPYVPKEVLLDKILLIKNMYYMQELEVDEVEFIYIRDNFTSMNMFLVGDIDIILNVSNLCLTKLPVVPYNNNYKVDFLLVNTDRVDKTLREALSNNIDRDELSSLVFGSTPAYSYLPDSLKSVCINDGTNTKQQNVNPKDKQSTQDKQINKKQYKKKIKLLCSTSYQNLRIAQYLQAKLSSAGINIEIESMPIHMKSERVRIKDYDLAISGWNVDHALLPFDFFSIFTAQKEYNPMNWYNIEFDEIMDSAYKSYTTKEKGEFLLKANEIIRRELPVIPLYFSKSFYVANKKIEQISISTGASSIDLRSIKLDRVN